MARQSDRIVEWETEVGVADYVCQATMCSLTYPYKKDTPSSLSLSSHHHLPSFYLIQPTLWILLQSSTRQRQMTLSPIAAQRLNLSF